MKWENAAPNVTFCLLGQIFVQTVPLAVDTSTGGELDENDIPTQEARWVENVRFPDDAPRGNYRYFVRNFSQKGAANEEWYLSVHEGASKVRFHTGSSLREGQDSAHFKYLKTGVKCITI